MSGLAVSAAHSPSSSSASSPCSEARRRPRGARGRQSAPGQIANWTEGDKDGFGTATALASKVWLTLGDGELTEVYHPDLGTPSVRDLQFAVSDCRTFTEREDAEHEVRLVDRRSLTYRQVSTARSGRWRITKTYVSDPARSAVLVDVVFNPLTDRPYQLYALFDRRCPTAATTTAASGLAMRSSPSTSATRAR